VIRKEKAAQVWIWDEGIRREATKENEANISHVLPETVLHPRPEKEDILHIGACMEGIEARIWKNGLLVGSRWWEGEISLKEWKLFLVAHDLNPLIEIPDTGEMLWSERAWGISSKEPSFSNLRREKLWVSIVMALLIFLLIWQGVSVWRWNEAGKTLAKRVEVLSQEVEPLLEARNQASKYKEAADKLISLVSAPTQLELMAAVTEKLPPKNVLLTEWRYNQGNLTFTIQVKNPDPRYYVEAYQKMPYFKDVSAERKRKAGQLEVKMVIRE